MKRRILIVGHGNAGRTLGADALHRGETVVGYLDDKSKDPEVLGRLNEVNRVIENEKVDLIYFAIPSVDAATVRNFINQIDSDTVELAIVPRTYEIITRDRVRIEDLTDVDVLDLIGRKPVRSNQLDSEQFIKGKRIIVTGAAGSIGSHLVRQLAAMGAGNVHCIDWWENGLFFLKQELQTFTNVSFEIADVKNRAHLEKIFEKTLPEVVFHAAAYKHVPLMQLNPLEAFNNNVLGSLNVMELAIEANVKNLVYVSTDKAVNPVNVMGATKRIGELLMLELAPENPGTKFNAVRFGNVIESNGSVMQIFRNQIAHKSSLTVTDPEVTRYFMTIGEAGHLIIQSAQLGKDGEIFVLDMGEPVKILDLARSLVKAVDPSIRIEIIGLRPGEKMFEELNYEPDSVDSTSNEKIFVVRDSGSSNIPNLQRTIWDLLELTLNYRISNEDLISRLRNFGFSIQ